MLELIGLSVGLLTVIGTLAWICAAVALPLAWLWMLVDALFRDPADYPNRTDNEKVIWVIFMALVHPVAFAYFFLVYRGVPRGARISQQVGVVA